MFTIQNLFSRFMALLTEGSLDEYEITFMDDYGNLFTEYILAKDVETAAFNAFELSSHRDMILKDVRLCDEW